MYAYIKWPELGHSARHTKLLLCNVHNAGEMMLKKVWKGKSGDTNGGATIAITLILWRPGCLPIALWECINIDKYRRCQHSSLYL